MFANHLTSVISTPEQQISAVIASRDFLLRLTRAKETPRVPPCIRREALALLRHFPPPERLRPALEQQMEPPEPKPEVPLTSELGIYWPAAAHRSPKRPKQSDTQGQD